MIKFNKAFFERSKKYPRLVFIDQKIKEERQVGPNILLTRVDNRLVHGQVGVTWVKSLGANLIVVVDDVAANSDVEKQLMEVVAKSSGVGIRFFTIEHTINIIHKASPNQKILIVCKTPETVKKLVDGGVPIKEVNIGNMHFSEGKEQLSKKVYVDQKDRDDIKYLESKGVDIYIQDVPGDKKLKV